MSAQNCLSEGLPPGDSTSAYQKVRPGWDETGGRVEQWKFASWHFPETPDPFEFLYLLLQTATPQGTAHLDLSLFFSMFF